MNKLKVLLLLALASLVLVIPASAATMETMVGLYMFGAGKQPPDETVLPDWVVYCPTMAVAEYDAEDIKITYYIDESCNDPIFASLSPLTFTGKWAQGTGKRIRQIDSEIFLMDDGSMGGFMDRFEAVSGCEVVKDKDTNLRMVWRPGINGGGMIRFSAQCGDELFGVPTSSPVLQWGWGFMVEPLPATD